MPAFTVLKGTAAPLNMDNIDTDMIIPKQFLKTIKRTGLGKSLFYEIRYDTATDEERPDFVLNKPEYRSSSILIAGENFGCGSSREHAPWALNDFGIRCIIAPSFADIFFNNCFKNGMLPIRLTDSSAHAALLADAEKVLPLEIDLPNQRIVRSNGETVAFEVEEFRKHCLVNGLDDIGLTMIKAEQISRFEARRSDEWPWLDGKGYRGDKVGAVKVPAVREDKKKMDW
ncbi:3-isopropylmalate dehydratase [Rhizophlyctis rosea]|uniref:3-isopropylmalate dehydratase n=1 Tax=Rhizophlyctis rosea TaxID=64517 RepID=A0AAD5S1P5_9FUNG|nr:3-isopropylmalate dehydratase [Rhizophlyctis rosea]